MNPMASLGRVIRARGLIICTVLARVIIFAFILCGDSRPLHAVECFKPWGLQVRQKAYEQSDDIRALGAQLAGDGDFVYIKDCTSDKDVEDWYVYSSSKDFQDMYETKAHHDVSTGLDVEMAPGEGKRFLASYEDTGRGFLDIIAAYGNTKVIIVEGNCEIPTGFFAGKSNAPLILRLNPHSFGGSKLRAQVTLSIASELRRAHSDSVAVISLIPSKPEDIQPWGFDEHKATIYAENGAKIRADLDAWGAPVMTPKTREEFVNTVKSSSQSTIYIIGESSDNGRTVRLPGSSVVLTQEDFKNIDPEKNIIGLICGSEKVVGEYAGLAVLGKIYTDQTRTILRFALDRRDPATSSEFIDSGAEWFGPVVESAVRTFGPDNAISFAALARPTTPRSGGTPVPRNDSESIMSSPKVALASVDGLWDRSEGASTGSSTIGLLAAGLFGGFLKEFFRWNKLGRRKRRDLFLRPKFIILSAIFVCSGAGVGWIFGSTVKPPWSYVIAWVAGVGLEELVRRAAKLKVWTPVVAQGSGDVAQPSPPTYLEFLRAG